MEACGLIHPITVPDGLHWGQVRLQFSEFIGANDVLGLSPRYIFGILDPYLVKVGYITMRFGDSWHITYSAGHIGYRVDREHQGHGYAYQACMALTPFIRAHYDRVIITTSLTNQASIRTIERLGAQFIEIVEIPPEDPAFASGDMRRRRYQWEL